jgi:hypothetical protein
LDRVAPHRSLSLRIRLTAPRLEPREVLGVGVVLAVVLVAATSLRTVRPPELSEPLKLWLLGVAILFALLGAAVHRWTMDPWLGRTFLIFGGATALALASMPGALRGYASVHFLAASSATVASAAFTTVFVSFPAR